MPLNSAMARKALRQEAERSGEFGTRERLPQRAGKRAHERVPTTVPGAILSLSLQMTGRRGDHHSLVYGGTGAFGAKTWPSLTRRGQALAEQAAALSPPQGRPDIIPNQIDNRPVFRLTGSSRAAINKCPHEIVPACAHRPAPIRTQKLASGKSQERESSESPMLNAFCRVAPSVLFNFLAICDAAVFFFAIVFSSRISLAVQARRFFDFLAINPPFKKGQLVSHNGSGRKYNRWFEILRIAAILRRCARRYGRAS